MSEEEKKAIKDLIKEKIETLREYLEYGMEYKDYLEVVNAFDYIDNLIEKQQKEIENLIIINTSKTFCEKIGQDVIDYKFEYKNITKVNNSLFEQIQLKDKVIDEMAKWIEECTGSCPSDMYDWQEIDCENECEDTMKKCWKQYFINKVKEKK